MKYFIDTEFIEAPFYLAPISVAVVAEDGREFYAIDDSHDASKADPWVVANVLSKLPPRDDSRWMTRAQIADGLRAFVGAGGSARRAEFWAYFADYDWVLFCWLHGGRMIDMPKGYPFYCMDLKQAMVERGVTKEMLPPQTGEHDALEDARWGMWALRYVLSRPCL